jgi:hypothetical protein
VPQNPLGSSPDLSSGVAYLKVEVGSEPGRCYELNRDEVTIGRHDACTILLNEGGKVSRWHAAISRREGRSYVRDMGSRNGTFLNDAPLGERASAPAPRRSAAFVRYRVSLSMMIRPVNQTHATTQWFGHRHDRGRQRDSGGGHGGRVCPIHRLRRSSRSSMSAAVLRDSGS